MRKKLLSIFLTIFILVLVFSCSEPIEIYKVSFDSQGGKAVDIVEVVNGSKIDTPDDPTKIGYTFGGWYKEASLINEWNFSSDKVTSNITLYAKWIAGTATAYKVEHYQQNIDDNNYTLANTDNLVGRTKDDVTAVSKVYIGFSKNETHEDREPTGIILADGTLVLKLYYDRDIHTVIFNSNGGSDVTKITDVRYETQITEPADPTKTGYTFGGWYKEASLTNEWNFSSDKAVSNITLYAKWEVVKYSITYHLDGGTNNQDNPTTYSIESDTITLADPKKEGYSFEGWYDAASGGNKVTEITKDSSEDKSLYARWSINQYTINFDCAGGSEVDPITQNYESSITAFANPTKTGYTFDSWYPKLPETMPAEDTTITAQWIANRYTVTFDTNSVGSVDPSSLEVTYDSTYGELPNPISKIVNYKSFKGWYSDQATSEGHEVSKDTLVKIADNHTLYAKWEELAVKDLGPAGGYIFYENPNYEADGWRYLEAAPKGWSGPPTDPSYVFGAPGTPIGKTETAIGSGKENTKKIVQALGGEDYAAKIAYDYESTVDGVEYKDWFLPSRDELNEMYKNLKQQGLGGFAGERYWSSSDLGGTAQSAYYCDFKNGTVTGYNRGYSYRVRPVRAF